jgi:hypothetical protein
MNCGGLLELLLLPKMKVLDLDDEDTDVIHEDHQARAWKILKLQKIFFHRRDLFRSR